jgi:hypothetical protein
LASIAIPALLAGHNLLDGDSVAHLDFVQLQALVVAGHYGAADFMARRDADLHPLRTVLILYGKPSRWLK